MWPNRTSPSPTTSCRGHSSSTKPASSPSTLWQPTFCDTNCCTDWAGSTWTSRWRAPNPPTTGSSTRCFISTAMCPTCGSTVHKWSASEWWAPLPTTTTWRCCWPSWSCRRPSTTSPTFPTNRAVSLPADPSMTRSSSRCWDWASTCCSPNLTSPSSMHAEERTNNSRQIRLSTKLLISRLRRWSESVCRVGSILSPTS